MSEEKERTVHVIGAGGVGFWLAVGLSRSGLGIVVYDDDNLTGGMGHQRLPLATPTTLKTDLLRGFLRVNFGGRAPVFVTGRFSGSEVHEGDLVVDCSDMDGHTRKRVWKKARKGGARLLRVSYDGANSTMVVAEGLPLTGNESASGYANVPSLALSLAAGGIGAETVLRMIAAGECEHVEYQISLADYVVQRSSGRFGPTLEHNAVDALAELASA